MAQGKGATLYKDARTASAEMTPLIYLGAMLFTTATSKARLVHYVNQTRRRTWRIVHGTINRYSWV